MLPPFREEEDIKISLWAGLQSGSLSVAATDHCAFTKQQKRMGAKRSGMYFKMYRRA